LTGELFLHTLKDVYFAEHEILKTLPKMAQAAKNGRLKQAFDKHRIQTEGQFQRLQRVFSLLDQKAEGAPCEAIQGILAEGSEVMEEFAGGPALDAGLIAAAQAVEHYEIARYDACEAGRSSSISEGGDIARGDARRGDGDGPVADPACRGGDQY
jgi:ferritin-like metal-binding protein YciE